MSLTNLKLQLCSINRRSHRARIPRSVLTLVQFVSQPRSPSALGRTLQILISHRGIPARSLGLLTRTPRRFLCPNPLSGPPSARTTHATHHCYADLLQTELRLSPCDLFPFLKLALNCGRDRLTATSGLTTHIDRRVHRGGALATTVRMLRRVINSRHFATMRARSASSVCAHAKRLAVVAVRGTGKLS